MVTNKDDNTSHECSLCKKIIVANNNTTNSKRHMEVEHSTIWRRALERRNQGEANDELEARESDTPSQSSSSHIEADNSEGDWNSQTVGNSEPECKRRKTKQMQPKLKKLLLKNRRIYGRNHIKKLKLDEDVGRLVAENFEPYSIVERPAFIRYSNRLDSRYVLPSRNTVATKIIPNLFRTVKEKLIARLAEAKYKIFSYFYKSLYHSTTSI